VKRCWVSGSLFLLIVLPTAGLLWAGQGTSGKVSIHGPAASSPFSEPSSSPSSGTSAAPSTESVVSGSVSAGILSSPKNSAPTCPGTDDVLLWLAGGISTARVQRLAGDNFRLACHITPSCERTLEKGGADANLIRFLAGPDVAHQKLSGSGAQKPGISPAPSCKCAGAAADIAALVHAKSFATAEEKLHALLENDPHNASLLFVLGTVLRREDRLEESFDAFSDSVHLMPGFVETHGQLSYYFYRSDDSDNAIAEARTALSIDPSNAEAYRFLGLAHYADGHYEAALNAYEESLLREPDNADVYFDMGITQRDKGDLRRAAIAYHHALALRADFWEAHSNLGVVLRDEGKLDEAAVEFRAALRLKPDEASVRSNLGNTLCDKEDFDKAIAEFKALYQQQPNWEGGHNCLARAYMSKRDYPSAIRELRAAIDQNPAGAAEYRVLGQALLLTGKDDEAVEVLRKAVSLNPESALGHHYLGTALVNTQAMAEAEKEFREALRLQPSGQNHYSLAACLMALNRYEEALGELEIASRLDPQENLYRARMQEAARMITTTK
jgi:tetratricopeptide (TPR) repeat protein